jgi:hypothetical protein
MNDAATQPFFYAREINGRIEIKGDTHCCLGHQLTVRGGESPDGVFAEWHWDGQQLTVTNDKFGFFPLFYYVKDQTICVSPSLVRILELCEDRSVHYPALSVFLRLGYFLRDDTPFQYIKAVGPRVSFRWADGRLSMESNRVRPSALMMPREQAMDTFAELMREAVKKRCSWNSDFVLPLSGGRDSRHIIFAMDKLGFKPKMCVSYHFFPDRADDDVRIAQMIADRFNIPLVVLTQTASRFQTELRKNLVTSFCSDEHAQSFVIADYLHGQTKVIFDGIAGMLAESFLITPKHGQLYRENKYRELAESLLAFWGPEEHLWSALLNKTEYAKLNRDTAIDYIVSELKEHARAPNPIASFHFWNRTRREINLNPYAVLGNIPTVYSPYLDHDLCEFLLSLPIEWIEGGTFHEETIRRAYPEFADIPYEDKTRLAAGILESKQQMAAEFVSHFLSHPRFRLRFINPWYFWARVLRYRINPKYYESLAWVGFAKVIYLLQLDEQFNHPRD